MTEPTQVLVVCSGNTCRSPMAQALLQKELNKESHPFRVASAGTSGGGGKVTEKAVCVLGEDGAAIKGRTSRALDGDVVAGSSMIFCMGHEHQKVVMNRYDLPQERVQLFAESDIKDPLGEDTCEAYRDCRDSIVAALPGVVDRLRSFLAADGRREV